MLLNKKIPLLFIFNKVRYEVLYVLLVSIVVLYLTERYNEVLPSMPLTIPTFIGTAISILLSFKLNQSYDRWWEARKVWGSIVNDSRSLVIQLKTLAAKADKEAVKKIAYRQIAWCYCLGQSLRSKDAMEGMEKYLSQAEMASLNQHNNKPLALLHLHGIDILKFKEKEQIDAFSHVQLDNTLVRLCDSQGKCERIKSTVFPVTYRLFLHFIIYLFVITLAISLKDVAGYFEMPLLVVISSSFFLLERSATHMQDPFENRPTDTAVTAIATTIEINIKQLLNEQEVPKSCQPDDFYLM